MLQGAVLFAVTGMFVGAMRPLGMVYGLIYEALLGAMLGFAFGAVRTFTFQAVEEESRIEKRVTLWRSLSDNQRVACKVALLVFGSEALLFVLGGMLVTNFSGRMGTAGAVASLLVGMVALCVACVLFAIRLRSKEKAGKVDR